MTALAPQYQPATRVSVDSLQGADLDLVRLAYAVETFRKRGQKVPEPPAPRLDPSLWSDFLGVWSEAR